MALPNTYFKDLLQRYVDILESDHFGGLVTGMIAIPAKAEITTDPQAGPWPHVRVYTSQITQMSGPMGAEFIGYNVTVAMRLLTGAVSSGGVAEKEMLVDELTAPILNKFALFKNLQHPDSLEDFDMLDPLEPRFVVGTEKTQFGYGPQESPVYYVGCEFTEELKLFTKRR